MKLDDPGYKMKLIAFVQETCAKVAPLGRCPFSVPHSSEEYEDYEAECPSTLEPGKCKHPRNPGNISLEDAVLEAL